MNQRTIKFRKTELGLLFYLVDYHMKEGSYFGRKDQHYKMVSDLHKKIEYEYDSLTKSP